MVDCTSRKVSCFMSIYIGEVRLLNDASIIVRIDQEELEDERELPVPGKVVRVVNGIEVSEVSWPRWSPSMKRSTQRGFDCRVGFCEDGKWRRWKMKIFGKSMMQRRERQFIRLLFILRLSHPQTHSACHCQPRISVMCEPLYDSSTPPDVPFIWSNYLRVDSL